MEFLSIMEKALSKFFRTSEDGKYSLENYPDIAIVKFMDIDYLHTKCNNGGDLYVTKYGLSLFEQVKPENWYDNQWFCSNREKLKGTSTVYKVTSKKVNGKRAELIVKWSRVGQHVPLETKVVEDVINAEFNTPFEEFSLGTCIFQWSLLILLGLALTNKLFNQKNRAI